MQKISGATESLAKRLPFSYFSSTPYLDFAGYQFERNGENLIVAQDLIYAHEFPSIFMPEKVENWACCSVTFATDNDKAALENAGIPILVDRPSGLEFFYKTDSFIQPTGSLKEKIGRFTKNYEYSIAHTYDTALVQEFYDTWKGQRDRTGITFDESEQFFQFCLNNLDTYKIRQVYVEVEGVLVGFAWGVAMPHGGWVGLHLKVDYAFKGLSRFLHHERAKLFAEYAEFTLGTGAREVGIEDYKRELHPCHEIAYSYILTGEKL